MYVVLSVVVTLLLSLTHVAAANTPSSVKQSILVATEEWPGYTDRGSDGIYDHMLKQVFAGDKFDIVIEHVSFSDSLTMHKRQLADIALGVYGKDVSKAIYPDTHLDVDVIVAIHRKSHSIMTLAQLAEARVAWMTGYRYNRYFPQLDKFIELDSRKIAVKLLQSDKLELFVDYQTEAINLLATTRAKVDLTTTTIGYLKSYPIFQPDEKGRQLAKIWDQKMTELIQSSYFRPHFAKTKNQIYPYDPEILSKAPLKSK